MVPTELLERIKDSVSGVTRPDHFTDHEHCPECAEHDQVLRAHTPESIGLSELGSPGWDPICFISDQGFLYYLPGLARLALGTVEDYYLDQFLFHLPSRLGAMNGAQRAAVLDLLEYLLRTHIEEVIASADARTLVGIIERLRPR